jgi:glycolate oxidase iron-sulfur subunit
MKTQLPKSFLDTAEGKEANRILRSCVHCGFCNATCPTYQILGDELDGPRGRIYQIKNALEGQEITKQTQLHLDRCLTCLNCETTCPSGVEYHRLLDIGRAYIEKQVPRKKSDKIQRWMLRQILTSSKRVKPFLTLAQWVRPILPKKLKNKIPLRQQALSAGDKTFSRKVLMLQGCAQPAMTPRTNQAASVALNQIGVQMIYAESAGCCGALSHHINAGEEARQFMRNNIDAWWPYIEGGVEAIVASASGCGVHIKEYGALLAHDEVYAKKAKKVSELARDLCEIFTLEDMARFKQHPAKTIAYHPPCTLQHGQKLAGRVEALLEAAGYTLKTFNDSHLCCGSAGVYSVLQPALSNELKQNKIDLLHATHADEIVTANIGCQLHLQTVSSYTIKHWIELLV